MKVFSGIAHSTPMGDGETTFGENVEYPTLWSVLFQLIDQVIEYDYCT